MPGGTGKLTDAPPPDLFEPRTSVFLSGHNSPLLNWVAYALVADRPGGYIWGHVKLEGEVLDDADLLKTSLIPRDRFITVFPRELVRDEVSGNVALGGLMRSEGDEEAVRQFAEFISLPGQTQELISQLPSGGPRPVLVLSGGHRLAPLYSAETVGPTIRSVIEFGSSMLVTWADAPVEARFEFERILRLRGDEPRQWREAVLTVERGWSTGPLHTGAELRLGDIARVASVLGKNW